VLLISRQRHRAMLTRLRNTFAHAHRTETPSRPALHACGTSLRMPIAQRRHRALPSRARNALAHAHRTATWSRHAHSRAQPRRAMPSSSQPHRIMPCSRAKRRRRCPAHDNAIVPCPLTCATSSRMLISLHCHRAMPTRVRKVILTDAGGPTGACS